MRELIIVMLAVGAAGCADEYQGPMHLPAETFDFSLSVAWKTTDGLPADMLELLVDGAAGDSIDETDESLIAAQDHTHRIEIRRGDVLTAQRVINHTGGCDFPIQTIMAVRMSFCALPSGELTQGKTTIDSTEDSCVIDGVCVD